MSHKKPRPFRKTVLRKKSETTSSAAPGAEIERVSSGINLAEIACNLALVIFGYLLSYEFFEKRDFFSAVDQSSLLAVFLIASVAIAWFSGFTLASYKANYTVFVFKAATVITVLLGLTLLIYLFVIVNSIIQLPEMKGKFGEYFSFFAMFFIVLGPMIGFLGFYTGKYKPVERDNKKIAGQDYDPKYMPYLFGITIIATVAILISLISTDAVQHSKISFLYFILAFIAAPAGGALILVMMMQTLKFLKKLRLNNPLKFLFQIAFPFLIVASLILINALQQHYLQESSKTGYIGLMFLSGLLPFRLLLIFSPPLRIIQIALGLGCLFYYFYSVVSL